MVIIQPLKKKFGKDFFPFGLVFLSAILILVFLTVQIKDNKYRNDAIQYYFQNNLNEVEFPLYVKFARKYMRDDFYYAQLENIANGKVSEMEMYWLLRTDPFFQGCLNNDQCISPSTLTYLKWQDKRREYLHLLEKNSFYKYGFKPADPSVVTLFTNLVINADLYQFISNLLFLIVVCVVIEEKIGLFGLLLCYLICGASMTSTYSLLAPFSLVPVSGVNGAVAGLIGMMLVICKGKQVNIKYFNFKEISTKSISCIAVFILWSVVQALLLYFTAFDVVDFVSESVALCVGVLLALMINNVVSKKSRSKYSDKPTDLQARLGEAVNEISLMNYGEAKKILYPLLDEYPTNKEIYFQLFNIVKSNPSTEEYHGMAQKIFLIKDSSRATVTMINLVFKNYIRRARPTIRFDIDTFFSLLQRFRKAGFYEDAEKILKVLIKHNSQDALSEILAREQLLLARCYLLKKDKVHGDRLLEWLVETFPNTESAKQAKTFVDIKNTGFF